jgi:hypothetical protein
MSVHFYVAIDIFLGILPLIYNFSEPSALNDQIQAEGYVKITCSQVRYRSLLTYQHSADDKPYSEPELNIAFDEETVRRHVYVHVVNTLPVAVEADQATY